MALLFGFGTGRPGMPWPGRRMFVQDAGALAAAFRKWVDEPDLARIVVSHGDVIVDEPRAVLRRVAADLQK